MALNKIRLIRSAAEKQGFPLECVAMNIPIKPVRIHLTKRMDDSLKTTLASGFNTLKAFNVDFELNVIYALV